MQRLHVSQVGDESCPVQLKGNYVSRLPGNKHRNSAVAWSKIPGFWSSHIFGIIEQ